MSAPPAPPTFVGIGKCAGCHPRETEAYRGSDHARAMQAAGPDTVLGDFRAATFSSGGTSATFSTRDGKYFVRTDGPDGRSAEFEISHTFGVTPLQQYLVPFPKGRLQALGIAWDTRARTDGGQRWFHLYPGGRLRAPDSIHWTGREQTWNYQCAECHSTDLRKGYDLATDTYRTTWAELTVSCEACHGPGSAHVAQVESRGAGAAGKSGAPGKSSDAGQTAFPVALGRPAGTWAIKDAARGIAEWTGRPRTTAEVDACARCHARRRSIVDPYPYGRPLLDTHVPALLDAALYHADGQILGEVYEWGSFVQSRMFRAGVTCSDCHDPHSGRPRAAGNQVCAQCHAPAKFDTAEHHHHRPDSAAARCVSCHMPARTYMVVDPRRDHGFRVPRPDLSATGAPDACTGCHRDRIPRWAAERIVAWFGATSAARRPHFAVAIDAGRRGRPEAGELLAGLATDAAQPAIARATAVSLLPGFVSVRSLPAVESALRDPNPLVRATALRAVESVPPEARARFAVTSLRDPVRAVRVAAARAMVTAYRQSLTSAQQADFERALAELLASEMVNAERPEAHLNLAAIQAGLGRPTDAEASLRTALRLDPRFVPALVNLADLYRSQGRNAEGGRLLEEALRVAPDSAEALHALGLQRVRQGRTAEGVGLLRRAAELRPESVQLAYVYAVALHSTGDTAGAIRVLEQAYARRPASREVLVALATYNRDRGDRRSALAWAEKLVALQPGDRDGQALVDQLRGSPRPAPR